MHDSSTEMDAEAEDAKKDRQLWESLMQADLVRQIKMDLATIGPALGWFLQPYDQRLRSLLKHLSKLRRIGVKHSWICSYEALPAKVREEILSVLETLHPTMMDDKIWLLRGCLDWQEEFGDGRHCRESLEKAIELGSGEAALILAWRDFYDLNFEDPSCLCILSNLSIAVEAGCSATAAKNLLHHIILCFEETDHLEHHNANTVFSRALDIIESLCLSRQYTAELILKFGIYFEEHAESRADIEKARYWYEVARGYDGYCGSRRLRRLDELDR